jgi:starch synthase
LSIHNLAHQGWGDGGWLALLGQHSWAYEFGGAVNALVGAIRLAHRVVAVSPTYAEEIRGHAEGQGLDVELTARGDALTGILNGIDTEVWNPATDPALPNTYSLDSMNGKAATRSAVRKEFGVSSDGPLFVVVSRFDYQKAVDVLLATTSVFETLPGSLVLLGNGDPGLEEAAASVAAINPRVTFIHGYLKDVAHRLFAAGDFAVVPSRFEPCGLTQMQAMRYGTIPIVTRVGGLADTVIDADRDPDNGTGIVAERAEVVALTDALHRAARLARNRAKFSAVRARGMAIDWSWSGPSEHYISLYKSIL